MLNIFYELICHLYTSSAEVSVQIFCPFGNSLRTDYVKHFSCAYLPSVYKFCRSVCSNILPISLLGYLFPKLFLMFLIASSSYD